MTLKEIVDGLQFTLDMFLFDPTTGETYPEPRNDMDKITIDACKGAIELLEQQPCEEYNYKALWEQVKWERDVATEQLEQLGYSLGEKIRTSEDCISRQAMIDAIYKKHIGGKDAIKNAPINDLYACGLEGAVDAVEDMPSVQLQQGHGEWIDNNCSICGYGVKEWNNTPYCPNCGAKMEV